jgi:hypothetical protein
MYKINCINGIIKCNKENIENINEKFINLDVLIESNKDYDLNNTIKLDAPTPWGLFFQDSASPQMEGIEELHNNIMFYLAIILFAVT